MPGMLRRVFAFALFSLFIAAGSFSLQVARADDQSDLQNKIDTTNSQIKDLQDQIAKLQSQLTSTTAQKQTLQNAINALNLNIQKLQKSITLTQTQISQKDDQISQLNDTITTTSNEVATTQNQVAESLRELQTLDNESPAIALLSGNTISDFFDSATTLASLRGELETKITTLGQLKSTLQSNKVDAETKLQELADLNTNLSQQQQGLAISRDSQNKLLTQTKSQESAYQAQIAEKKAEESKFESDLLDFQSQLNLSFSASTLPATGQGALAWPLKSIIITQYFGNTDFATQNPQIYNGHGHSGIDLGASPGTPVMAARDGVVLGTGNTDLTCPGASFGKWIFIKHDNGLSTLYAHLASFTVAQGDTVKTGQVIAYSDTTGYATGPHLHFGVYASAGSEIASFKSSGCPGKTYTMPVADLTAYLNPLSYLPAVPKK
ncbi:MAG TPA: peptidoglycan DD-metalloendopeptidase family protein, partial [Candidatus Paceibacterota bacterium]|nr:peptidoglycan DD-metalloendopeptidase family protein [Candidatus Paceibacterota bacterium]